MNTDILYPRIINAFREFVDIILPCKNIDFSIRGVLAWAREHATAKQKHDFIKYFYDEEVAAMMNGAFQIAKSEAVIYKDPFNKEALDKLNISKLFEIFEISSCPTEYFSIYFLEYKRISKIRSRAYMNKINKQREEYSNFMKNILER